MQTLHFGAPKIAEALMRAKLILSFWLTWTALLIVPVLPAAATSTLTGADAVSAFFDPNLTHPDLALSGAGSVENSGGVAIFSNTSFVMELDFLNNSPPGAYDNIILTAALASGVDYSGLVISVSLGSSTAQLVFNNGDFIDAMTFGLPFPSNGIKGIGNGAGDFLSLNGALVGGFDLETSLVRGVNNPLMLAVDIAGISSPDQIIRFDAFGQNGGNIVIGNNPNSGAAGFMVPEPRATLLFAVGVLIAGIATRRRVGLPIRTR